MCTTRLSLTLPFAALLALPAVASANCYSMYDGQNRLTFQSTIAPVDLSTRISDSMRARFPGNFLVILPDDSDCLEFRSGSTVSPRFDAGTGSGQGAASENDKVFQAPLLRGAAAPIDSIAGGATSGSGNTLNVRRSAVAPSGRRAAARPRRRRRRGRILRVRHPRFAMYLPAHFAESRPDVLHALIAAQPLGLLVTPTTDGGLVANDIPFILDIDDETKPGVLRAHVARANPVWRTARTDAESLVVFQGAQGYISPAWYPGKAEHGKVVPTWNYIVVQARGTLRVDRRPRVAARASSTG